MKTQATKWLEELKGKKLLYNTAETATAAQPSALESYESEAQRLAARLIEEEIPAGIQSCISRGSDRLGVPVPFKFFATEAFQDVKSWAKNQGLILGVSWLRDVEIESKYKFAITISPDRSNPETGTGEPEAVSKAS